MSLCVRVRQRVGELGTGDVDFVRFLEGVGGSWGVSCVCVHTSHWILLSC